MYGDRVAILAACMLAVIGFFGWVVIETILSVIRWVLR